MRRRVILQRAGAIATVVTAWSLGTVPSLAAPDRPKTSPDPASDSVSTPTAEAISDAAASTEGATAEVATAEVATVAEKSTETDTEKHPTKHGKKAHKTHKE